MELKLALDGDEGGRDVGLTLLWWLAGVLLSCYGREGDEEEKNYEGQ